MSIIDVNYSKKDGSGIVYLVSDEGFSDITQAGYVPIETLTNAEIDYTEHNVFLVEWQGGDGRGHVGLFNPVLDVGTGDITLASYF